ncbi:hypothetical protein LTR96_007462 [Exophiala xenobiotica]|nr:hypothetical protein LTR92_007980 [Exophiala xenobiotica]KAK5532575.1 hypothetical protein LTR23_009544 [Chaetothyriales sp. CCFEE 6169]KAK5219003.1 hypothetical protein LTR72_008185 [Exophiala xenobiotica]KAK5235305.1 hypothetical protein LTR47_003490 [Exophiala xenobiotica]KAK5245889.1 hypothetical protein LTS06_008725 [Exophiala xenobiotica]
MSAPLQDADKLVYKLTFYVPTPSTKSVLDAVWSTGAGTWPNGPGHDPVAPPKYTETCFISSGTGQFKPSVHADPHIGKPGVVEYVQEDRVEMVVVGKTRVRRAVDMLREAHPYGTYHLSYCAQETIHKCSVKERLGGMGLEIAADTMDLRIEVVAFFVTKCEDL